MNRNLTNKENKKILERYHISLNSSSKKKNREKVQQVLTNKFCRCVKKIGINNEPRSIGICTKTIFTKKSLRRGKINCTGKNRIVEFFQPLRKITLTRKSRRRI
jgi:hypothetical protein